MKKEEEKFKRYLIYLAKSNLITEVMAVIGRERGRKKLHLRHKKMVDIGTNISWSGV